MCVAKGLKKIRLPGVLRTNDLCILAWLLLTGSAIAQYGIGKIKSATNSPAKAHKLIKRITSCVPTLFIVPEFHVTYKVPLQCRKWKVEKLTNSTDYFLRGQDKQ